MPTLEWIGKDKVNALKEGWDCPFAYILASLANKTSKVDVEQILGRVLRQPYAKRHKSPLLNMSYVFTCSNDFRNTLDSIVSGLNMAGFSRKDFRVGEVPDPAPMPKPDEAEQMELGGNAPAAETDSFDDVDTEAVKKALEGGTEQPDSPLGEMLQDAQRQADSYDAEMKESGSAGFWGGELGEMLNQNAMQDDMNQEERNLIDIVVGLGNIRWWHRIIERKGFRLNGSINHYPDFMVMTKAGKLVLIEFKGDDRDNSDSKTKLELGRQWQAQTGPNYRYFMVFKNKDFGIDGAYKLEQFVEIMREL